jgi:hypothetical protein
LNFRPIPFGNRREYRVDQTTTFGVVTSKVSGSGPAPEPSTTTFRAMKTDGDSSLANLPSTFTVNAQSISPVQRLEAKNATTSVWTATTGVNMAIASTGTLPTVGLDTALTSTLDKALRLAAGQVYQAGDTTTGDVGALATNEDLIIEMVLDYASFEASGRLVTKRTTSTSAGWDFSEGTVTGRLQFNLGDGTTNLVTGTPGTGLPGLQVLHCFLDRDEATAANGGGFYANGLVASAFTTAPNTLTGSLSNASPLTVGSAGNFSLKSSHGVLYVAVYKQVALFPGGASNLPIFAAIANERAARLMGAFPTTALGTAAPNAATRTGTAMLDKVTSGVRRMFTVGPNWVPRLVRRQELVGGEIINGPVVESARTNVLLQSETLDNASWTKLSSTVTANAAAAPDGSTNSDAVIADATTSQHGVSQAVTLAVAAYVYSGWALKGDRNFVFLENTTVAGAQTWFNLATGAIGTVGVGVSQATIEAWGNGLFRCSIRFTGTAAAHTLQASFATSDNTTTFAGDAVTASGFLFGMQCESGADHASTYIPTTTASATRSAEVLTYVGSDGNVAATGPTTLTCDVMLPVFDNVVGTNFALTGGAATSQSPNGFGVALDPSTDAISAGVRAASVVQMATVGTTKLTDGERHTLKVTQDTNSGKAFVDGVQEGATDTVLTSPAVAPVVISIPAGANAIVGNVTISNAVV